MTEVLRASANHSTRTKLIHHADQGARYTSLEFTSQLAHGGLVGSYSRVCDFFGTTAMEVVWATIKT